MNAQERAAMQQALNAVCGAKLCEFNSMSSRREQLRLMDEATAILRAALAQGQAEPTGKDSLPVESVVAENATTQQQIEQTPPSEYRRGYWAGFAIGKREGRIEAEDALAQQAEPQDDELSAALGWPGGISDPVLDRKVLLQKVAALAQQPEPAQEPVAWSFEARHIDSAWGAAVSLKHPGPEGVYMRNVKPLYTDPPQRPPLTDAEMLDIIDDAMEGGSLLDLVRAVEKKVRGE